MRRLALAFALIASGVALIPQASLGAPPAGGLVPGARNRVAGALCEPALSLPAMRGETPRSNKLGELPPGNMVLTVVREVDGCAAPVIVRYGMNAGDAPAKARHAGTGR